MISRNELQNLILYVLKDLWRAEAAVKVRLKKAVSSKISPRRSESLRQAVLDLQVRATRLEALVDALDRQVAAGHLATYPA